MKINLRWAKSSRWYGLAILGPLLSLLLFNPGAVLAANLSVTNAPLVAGQTVNFSGDGFTPNETLSAWTTDPNGWAAAVNSVTADGGGQISYTLDTLGHITGRWYLTLHGLSSGLEAITPFDLSAGRVTLPDPTSDSGPVPQGGLQVTPDSGYAGQVFQFSGSGFAVKEIIKLWETTPLGQAYALGEMYADDNGKLTYNYTGHGILAGIWAVTAHGMSSGLERVGYLRLLTKTEGVANLQVSPDHGNNTTFFEVTGTNFFAYETYSYWFTAPDGMTYGGGRGVTANDGSLSFHCFIPDGKIGRWSIAVKGLTSNRQVIGFFNYDG